MFQGSDLIDFSVKAFLCVLAIAFGAGFVCTIIIVLILKYFGVL